MMNNDFADKALMFSFVVTFIAFMTGTAWVLILMAALWYIGSGLIELGSKLKRRITGQKSVPEVAPSSPEACQGFVRMNVGSNRPQMDLSGITPTLVESIPVSHFLDAHGYINRMGRQLLVDIYNDLPNPLVVVPMRRHNAMRSLRELAPNMSLGFHSGDEVLIYANGNGEATLS